MSPCDAMLSARRGTQMFVMTPECTAFLGMNTDSAPWTALRRDSFPWFENVRAKWRDNNVFSSPQSANSRETRSRHSLHTTTIDSHSSSRTVHVFHNSEAFFSLVITVVHIIKVRIYRQRQVFRHAQRFPNRVFMMRRLSSLLRRCTLPSC